MNTCKAISYVENQFVHPIPKGRELISPVSFTACPGSLGVFWGQKINVDNKTMLLLLHTFSSTDRRPKAPFRGLGVKHLQTVTEHLQKAADRFQMKDDRARLAPGHLQIIDDWLQIVPDHQQIIPDHPKMADERLPIVDDHKQMIAGQSDTPAPKFWGPERDFFDQTNTGRPNSIEGQKGILNSTQT